MMNRFKPVRVFAVVSGKGGVGKTNVAVNLGISLIEQGHRVALLDADMGLGNIDVLLGLKPKFNLFHVLHGERTLDEIMVTTPEGLKVIPTSSGIQSMSELSSMEQAAVIRGFGEIEQEIDVLIVDTAAGIAGSVINFSKACQEVIVVVCDEPTSLTDAYALIKVLNRDHGLYRFQILTNMVKNSRQGFSLYTKLCKVSDQYMDVTLNFLGSIPEDESLRKAVRKQRAVVQAFPSSRSTQAFKDLAAKTLSWPLADTAGGKLEFFIERMVNSNQIVSEALA